MADLNGFKTQKDSQTGNWTLECKGENFNTQEKQIKLNCANTNFSGDLIVDVKARDAGDKYKTSSDRFTVNVTPSIQFSNDKTNKIITSEPYSRSSFSIANQTGWISTITRYYNFTSKSTENYSNMYFNTTNYTVADSHRSSSSGNYYIIHDTKVLKIIENGQFTNQVDFGFFKARFSCFILASNSVTTSTYYNQHKIDDIYIKVTLYNTSSEIELPLKIGGALFMRYGEWYYFTQPGSSSSNILPSGYSINDIENLSIVIPDIWQSQDVQGQGYNGTGRTASITQISIDLQ